MSESRALSSILPSKHLTFRNPRSQLCLLHISPEKNTLALELLKVDLISNCLKEKTESACKVCDRNGKIALFLQMFFANRDLQVICLSDSVVNLNSETEKKRKASQNIWIYKSKK